MVDSPRMTDSAAPWSRWRLTVGRKFQLAVGVLLMAMLAVAGVGAVGLVQTHAQVRSLYSENLTTVEATAELAATLDDIKANALEQIPVTDPATTTKLDAQLDRVLLPAARQGIAAVRALVRRDPAARLSLDGVVRGLAEFTTLRDSGVFSTTGTTGTTGNEIGANAALAGSTSALLEQITQRIDELRVRESQRAVAARQSAEDSYRTTRALLGVGVAMALLCGLAVVLVLVRDLVPRIRRYSAFATQIATGVTPGALSVRGSDELAELGRALNDMVASADLISAYEEDRAEFVDTLQVTATEEEAHELVQRHLERSLPGSAAAVLKRNNSANRLEAATALDADNVLAPRLAGAVPRSCLALRFGRTHREGGERPPLLGCAVCTHAGGESLCEPLLVGGEVIGSVLVRHPERLAAEEDARIRSSVAQAAPVLANLRNLALTEFRASTDALTGLPNRRAADDTLKRMVAQANRSLSPLTALMLDLDHFKQINDLFGHGKGDEVLAAVGAALRDCVRASDFAGRYGGEEFLVLLPDTTATSALHVAEKMRTTIAALTIPGVERAITASLGLADLLEHAGSAAGLLHQADQALYAAKAAGRDRTVVAAAASDRAEVNASGPGR